MLLGVKDYFGGDFSDLKISRNKKVTAVFQESTNFTFCIFLKNEMAIEFCQMSIKYPESSGIEPR